MNILVDAMGGDNSPDAVIRGVVRAIDEIEGNITLVGNTEIIRFLYGCWFKASKRR